MINIFTKLVLFGLLILTTHAWAQFPIPGNGTIQMPPNCQAQYYYANYCVEANIIPENFNPYNNSPEGQLVWKQIIQTHGEQQALQCYKSLISWRSCEMYLRGQVTQGDKNECKNYWKNPYFANIENNFVKQAELNNLKNRCGGAIDQ